MKYKFRKLAKAPKRKWLEALRSGKYKQATHQLQIPAGVEPTGDGFAQGKVDHPRFCCLGVLCEATGAVYNPGQAELPVSIQAAIKLDDDAQQMLIELNDDKEWSFKKIATWIEKHL